VTAPVFRFNVGSTIANWIVGLALGVPVVIVFFVQLPMMLGGSEEAAANVKIAAVLIGIAGWVLTWRRKVTLDTVAKTVTWSRHLFGMTWRRETLAADRFVAMAVVRERAMLRTVSLVDREGGRRALQELASVHEAGELERYGSEMGWSVESGR
jgi:hypothetical protein